MTKQTKHSNHIVALPYIYTYKYRYSSAKKKQRWASSPAELLDTIGINRSFSILLGVQRLNKYSNWNWNAIQCSPMTVGASSLPRRTRLTQRGDALSAVEPIDLVLWQGLERTTRDIRSAVWFTKIYHLKKNEEISLHLLVTGHLNYSFSRAGSTNKC